jgi:hypothetical protein
MVVFLLMLMIGLLAELVLVVVVLLLRLVGVLVI